MKKINIIFYTILILSTACASKSGDRQSIIPSITNTQQLKEFVHVKKIVDGDTFYIEDGTRKGEKIRLIGVDTPEPRKTPKEDVQFYGKEASAYLSSLLYGKRVRLEYDLDRFDQYQRTLAYVYLEDGTFVNAELVKNGYAQVMTITPNVKYADLFIELQVKARNKKLGMWQNAQVVESIVY